MPFTLHKLYRCLLPVFLTVILLMPALNVQGVAGNQEPPPSRAFVATYFHTTMRCPTCQRIENLAEKVVKKTFAKELKSGALVWRAVNVDEPENRHYKSDYQLFTKSIILSELKGGKETRWKNFDKIWLLVRDEDAFNQYVASEISAWLMPK